MAVLNFIIQLIQIPAIILGLIAMVGLILQQKSFGEVLSGTVKTILGLLILSVGIGALINALIPIQNMFQAGFSGTGLQTFVTFDEGVYPYHPGQSHPLQVFVSNRSHDLDPCWCFCDLILLVRIVAVLDSRAGFDCGRPLHDPDACVGATDHALDHWHG